MMNRIPLVIKVEIKDALTSRWFFLYAAVFGGAVIVLFWTGITDSQVLGFTGISRFLLTYFQLCVVVLPVFLLVTTVRSFVGDKESNVLEYLLSLPVPLRDFYWGKLIGRFTVVLMPILAAIAAATVWARLRGAPIPWGIFGTYCLLLCALSWFFLGMAHLISSAVRRQETGLGIAFSLWLTLVLFLDVVLIGVFLKYQAPPELIISISLMNPLQDFRIASMALFDPDLTMLGPASWFLLNHFGKAGFLAFSITYPVIAGLLMAASGYYIFRSKDIV